MDDARQVATREGLEQGYCVVPADKKFLLLFTFLKKNLNKKVGRPGNTVSGGTGLRGRRGDQRSGGAWRGGLGC